MNTGTRAEPLDADALRLLLVDCLDPDAAPTNRLLAEGLWVHSTCIIPSPDNARSPKPTDPDIVELGKSLSILQLNPAQARPIVSLPGSLDLRAGARRHAAAVAAGLPLRVDLYDWDDRTAFAVTMAENHNRTDLTVLEEAKLCSVCLERFTAEDTADQLGHSGQWVRRRAALARLTDEARAIGHPDWTISYWEALALLEPDAQREVAKQIANYYEGNALSLNHLRQMCRSQTRSLDIPGLWPMDWDFPPHTCAGCYTRKLAVAYLPGLQEEGDDECLNATCYAARLEAWTKQRVAELQREHGKTIPILVDHKTKAYLKVKHVTDETWNYHKEPLSYAKTAVQVIVAMDGPPRLETRYIADRKPTTGTGTGKKTEPAPQGAVKRWQQIRTATQALAAHLLDTSAGEDSPITIAHFSETWQKRQSSAGGLLAIAAASFGLQGRPRTGRSPSYKPQRRNPLYGDKSPSPWQPFDCAAKPGEDDTRQQCLDRALAHLFANLCQTLADRLYIETLKAHADEALAEAKTICEFLGIDWTTAYAQPAGLED